VATAAAALMGNREEYTATAEEIGGRLSARARSAAIAERRRIYRQGSDDRSDDRIK
jgi:hypothetical protein